MESTQAPLRSKAAADLEDVFGLVDRGAAAGGAAEPKKAQPASKKRSLVKELFGDRRALELNVLHGNVRARDDAVAEALLTLDGGRLGARALADGVARCLEPLRAFFASAAEIRAVQAAVRRDGFRDADAGPGIDGVMESTGLSKRFILRPDVFRRPSASFRISAADRSMLLGTRSNPATSVCTSTSPRSQLGSVSRL